MLLWRLRNLACSDVTGSVARVEIERIILFLGLVWGRRVRLG